MTAHITGSDAAALHTAAHEHDCSWGVVEGLPVPYLVDHHQRFVYIDGRLPLTRYYEAIVTGMSELIGATRDSSRAATVIPIRPDINPGIRGAS